MRSLTPEEAALWGRVASTIRPLSRDKDDGQAPSITAAAETQPRLGVPVAATPAKPPQERRSPGTTLDSSWDRRLRSGSIAPDRIVDLHGMSLDGAWRAIDRALERIAAGSYGRCVSCADEIPLERLKANPTAERCFRCQDHFEKTHGHENWPVL